MRFKYVQVGAQSAILDLNRSGFSQFCGLLRTIMHQHIRLQHNRVVRSWVIDDPTNFSGRLFRMKPVLYRTVLRLGERPISSLALPMCCVSDVAWVKVSSYALHQFLIYTMSGKKETKICPNVISSMKLRRFWWNLVRCFLPKFAAKLCIDDATDDGCRTDNVIQLGPLRSQSLFQCSPDQLCVFWTPSPAIFLTLCNQLANLDATVKVK